MSTAVTKVIPAEPTRRKWQEFDAAVLIFVGCDFLFAILAGLFVTYRVGAHSFYLEVIVMFMLMPLKVVLCVVSLAYVIVRGIRKRANAYSFAALLAIIAGTLLVSIPLNLGRAIGRGLLASTGVDERVAKECLLLAESGLCKTDKTHAWIELDSKTWLPQVVTLTHPNETLTRLAPVARDLQSKCPTIRSLKPLRINCDPEHVLYIELSGGFDHFGYSFVPEGTNWVLRWYEEEGLPQELVRLARQEQTLTITN